MNLDSYRSVICADYDTVMNVNKWMKEIPPIRFDSRWEVQIIPPAGGATIRFRVLFNGKQVSVYLDCYQSLGMNPKPYWELYPIGGDTARFDMNDVEGLLKAIHQELD